MVSGSTRLASLLLAGAASGCVSSGGQADFSGVDAFWGVAEVLQEDEIPSPARWEALFQTPGYAIMKRHDNADALLERMLPLALMPSRVEERALHVAAGDMEAFYVRHLRGAVEQRAELDELRASLAGRDLVAEARRLASAWLPAGATESLDAPEVSFVLLEPDARGYERIVIDLALALELGDSLVPTVAHEAHHVFRDRLSLVRGPEGDFPERDLLSALDNLQAEGIADQIDKSDYLQREDFGDGPVGSLLAEIHARYVEAHGRADETLARMDALLAGYLADPGSAETAGRELRDSLVLGGHPVGFHMASAILEAFGRGRLVAHVGDPFAFVTDYSEAAEALDDGRHVFSADALAAVDRLREAFVAPPSIRDGVAYD